MKEGTTVTYVENGVPREATVTDVVGTGPSTFKVVNLVCGGVTVGSVYHANDSEGDYWTLDNVPQKKPGLSGGKSKAAATIGIKKGDE